MMFRGQSLKVILAIGLAAAAVCATACSSSTGSSGGGGSTQAAGSPVTTGPKPTGSPIKLGSLLTISNPAYDNSAVAATNTAWVSYINTELGGINGHPVQITNCDDKGDGATTTQCMTNLLASGVVAFVNNSSLTFGNVALPAMADAKVASIGGYPITPQEFSSPYVFPTTPGASGSYPSLAVYFRSTGAKKLAVVVTNTPAGIGVGQSVSKLWTSIGGESAKSFSFDPAAPDFTPLMSQVAAAKPDAVILAVGASPAGRMFKSLQVAGITAKVGATSTAAVKSVFSTVGSAANGIDFSFACVPPTTSGKDSDLYRHIMSTYAPKQELTNQTCVAASSLEYMLFILKQIKGNITRASVLAQLEQKQPWPGFLTHPMDPAMATAATPSVWNPYNTVSQYNNGKFTPVTVSDPGDLSDLIDTYAGMAWFSGTKPGNK
jgi:branched-chain amino acid transport system substrate-binding protein